MAHPHAAWGMRQVEAFNEFMPIGPWTMNLEARVYQQSGRELRISVLGSYDTVEASWLWGWANPGFGMLPVVAAAKALRDFGQEHDVPEFAEEWVDLSGFADPRFAAEILAFGAMGVLRADGYIGVQSNETGRLYMVPDDPQVPVAGPDPFALPRLLTTGGDFLNRPAFEMVAGYFHHFGLAWSQADGKVYADLPDGGTVSVSFDEAGRVAEVLVNATPATAAAS
jgi:hypothetical protein